MNRLVELIKQDEVRMSVLTLVHSLGLKDCYVSAGFLRNLVWDSLHSTHTPLNDIDVVFFDASDSLNTLARIISEQLNTNCPDHHWDVKNQAFMHEGNGDSPYQDTLDAMCYWPEKETAIGAALNSDGSISVISAFGLNGLFEGKISFNDKRSKGVFLNRVSEKKWLQTWPKLKVVC